MIALFSQLFSVEEELKSLVGVSLQRLKVRSKPFCLCALGSCGSGRRRLPFC